MTVFLQDHQLTYVSVPKCACTSLKFYFFKLEHGRQFDPEGHAKSIHEVYRSRPFWSLPKRKNQGHHRVAVVRERVERFLSGYHGKVLRERCLEKRGMRLLARMLGLPLRPTLDEFLENMRVYRLMSPVVYKHFQPLSYFMGRDASWFHRIYDMSEIEELKADVAMRTKTTGDIPHLNPTAKRHTKQQIAPSFKERIRAFYSEDFALFGHYFKAA